MGDWFPYCGPGLTPSDALARWNLDPWLLAVLLALGLWTVVTTRGSGRRWLLAGLGVLAVLFVSPLCALSSALFAVRTVHHVLIVALAAPLIAFGLPVRRVPGLAAATLIQAAIFWTWHAPAAYAAALSHDGIYWVMQLSILGSAVWFWTAVRRGSPLPAVAALLAAMMAMGLLGALLTFAPEGLYAPHALTTADWGLTPLEDQQAAGLIMWAPAAAAYLLAALMVLGRALGPGPGAPRPA